MAGVVDITSSSINSTGTQSDLATTSIMNTQDIRNKLAVYMGMSVLIVFTIAANSVVMICIRKDKALRTVSNIYIFSLAVADSLVGCPGMLGMTLITAHGQWPLGVKLCTVWIFIDSTCISVSMINFCLIAHDRYLALVQPLTYQQQRTTKDALIRICVMWAVCIIHWIICVVIDRHVIKSDLDPTYCFYVPSPILTLIQTVLVYHTPIGIMIYLYCCCLVALRKRYLRTANGIVLTLTNPEVSSVHSPSKEMVTGGNINPPLARSTNPNRLRPVEEERSSISFTHRGNGGSSTNNSKQTLQQEKAQRQMRNVRMLGITMAFFVFSWLPFCIFWPIVAYCSDCIPLPAYEYAYWSAYLNSPINPLLYFMCNRDFRTALKKLCGRVRHPIVPD